MIEKEQWPPINSPNLNITEVSCLGSAPGEDIGQFFPQVQFYNAPVVIVVVITITIVVVVIIIMRPSSLGGGRILRRTLSVCLSVCLSVRPVRPVLERHLAPPSELQ